MHAPMIPHRGAEFHEMYMRMQTGLQHVFGTARPVYIVCCSGTGLMEAGLRCLPRGRVLSLVNGGFAERFASIAERCGHAVERYEVDWGSAHDAGELDRRLAASAYTALTVVHSETSTGVLNDIQSIAATARKHGVLVLVDSVSGAGGVELRTDEWALDFVFTASQKALGLPPGVAFGVASERLIEIAESATMRGYYLDLVAWEKAATKGRVLTTPALPTLYALDLQLDFIQSEGLARRIQRHQELSAGVSRFLLELRSITGLHLTSIAPATRQSPTVTVLRLPEGIPAADFVAQCGSAGVQIGSGYGKMAGSTVRLGHMGDYEPADLNVCFDAMEVAAAAFTRGG